MVIIGTEPTLKQRFRPGEFLKKAFAVCLVIGIYGTSPAASYIWNGGGADANWSTAANWSGGVAPANNGTAAVVFVGTTRLAPNVDAAWDISSLTFSNTAGAFVLQGNVLNIRAGGVTNNSANSQIISNAITVYTNETWNAAANNLTFAGNVTTTGNNLLTFTGASNSIVTGVVSGTGRLTKAGAGTVFLSGANTYSGLTTVSAGALNLQNNSALGGSAGTTTVASGAQLQLQGGVNISGKTLSLNGTGIANNGALRNISGSNSWNGPITLAGTTTIDADADTLNLAGNLTNATYTVTFTNVGTILLSGTLGGGTGGLTKIGVGTLTVSGTNTYTGATAINAGILQFGASGGLIASSAITVNAGSTLDLKGNSNSILSLTGAGGVTLGGGTLTLNPVLATTFSGVISGTGGLVKAGTATNTLSGVNTYSGSTTINAGAISIAAATGLGNSANTLALSGGTLNTSATLTLAQLVTLGVGGGTFNPGTTTLTISGPISGSGTLFKLGTGTLALTGANTYLGGTVYGAGIIAVNADSALGDPAGAITFTNSATLTNTSSFTSARAININAGTATISSGTNVTVNFSGLISGVGALSKSGAGTLILSGANTYAGLTTVSAGVLNLQNSSALGGGSGGTTVTSGAQLQLQGGITLTGESLTLSGTGVATGGALRSLSGSNTWNGTITLAASSTIDADADTLNLSANIINATYLTTFTNVGKILLNGTLGGGTGGLTKTGTGLLQLNGANTYTGATTVNGGTVQFGTGGSVAGTTAVTVNTAGTLDLNGNNESILSLAGAGGVTLGGGNLTVNNTAATTYSGVMSGAGNLSKAGAAAFTMSGVNTYTGGTTINAGAISIAAVTALGNATNVLVLNGGTLTASATLTLAQPVTLGMNNGVLNPSSSSKIFTLSGPVNGSGALTKVGAGTLTLTGINTYLGGTTNAAGTLTINSDAALGNAAGPLTFSNTATLTTTASFTSARNILLAAGTATFSCGTGFTNTFNGLISGAGALTQSGAGVMVLGGNNTFTNTLTISAGTVRLGASGVLTDLLPVIIGKTTAILDLNNFTETIGSLASTAAGKVTLGSGSLTAGGNNLSTTNSAVISGTGGFTKAGTGTMILTGANTYTNTTSIAAGALELGASSRLASTTPLVINNGATFNMTWNGTNYSQTVASLAGAGSVLLGTTLTAGNTSTTIFSGTISGAGAFTKTGTGTQIFSGANTYSGATAINAGTLQVDGGNVASAVTVATTATLSGTGTVGSVAVNSGATNAPGDSAPGTLNSGSETWAGGGNFICEINDPAGVQGGSSGWDWLNISGTLTINATAGNRFNLKIVSLTPANASGMLVNFDNTATYVWTIASASGGISGFDPAYFNLDTSAFQNALGAGKFALSQSGNDLNLIFTTAAAAAVHDVQSGTLTSTGDGTNSVTLDAPVNPTNAFLIFNTAHNSSVPGGAMVRGSITDSNTVEFVRTTTESSPINIQWYVVEYGAGIRVQRGEVNQTNTVINVPLCAAFRDKPGICHLVQNTRPGGNGLLGQRSGRWPDHQREQPPVARHGRTVRRAGDFLAGG